MSSVPLARTDEMFGEASSDLPGFGEAGTLRLVDAEPFGADTDTLAGEDVGSGNFLTVQAGVLCSIGSGEVDLGILKWSISATES
jgi:hypothetical protein